jgi:hypothetical protein
MVNAMNTNGELEGRGPNVVAFECLTDAVIHVPSRWFSRGGTGCEPSARVSRDEATI